LVLSLIDRKNPAFSINNFLKFESSQGVTFLRKSLYMEDKYNQEDFKRSENAIKTI